MTLILRSASKSERVSKGEGRMEQASSFETQSCGLLFRTRFFVRE
jgi:hypothetical protein